MFKIYKQTSFFFLEFRIALYTDEPPETTELRADKLSNIDMSGKALLI